jgi:hypothetical protein
MTGTEAGAIADEQIAHWRLQGVSADAAWRALGLPWGWAVEWYEVRLWMVRWLRTEYREPRIGAEASPRLQRAAA